MKSLKKRFAALFCTAAMIISTLPAASLVAVEAKSVADLVTVSREVAADGCVLLKNENNALPLKKNAKVSVFGRAQCNYYSSGNGSGGGVKTDYRVGILEGLEKSGMVTVNSDLKNEYSSFAQKHKDNKDEWGATPCSQEEMPMTQTIADNAKKKCGDAAVVIIGRTSGEDSDMTFEKGSYRLSDAEDNMLKIVSNTFDKVIVVLNVTNIIDMSWVEKYPKIDSVVYAWTGGQEGGNGVADVLTGKVTPSGKLADTIAKDPSDYPAGDNYGKNEIYYQEDIYVGYRYFETFAQDRVQYPFGFGLSYTTFETKFERASVEDGMIKVVVTVKNTGDVEGREIVQVYYGAPMDGLGNPLKELAAFAKTRDLKPGESETISLNFRISEMASYDDGGMYQESAYVLEKGEYKIYVGNDVRSSKEVYTYNQKQVEIVEQLTEAAAPIKDFKRLKAVEENGKIVKKEENVPKLKVDVEAKIKKNLPDELKKKDNKTYTLKDVYDGKLTVEQFVAQMTNEQLGMLAQGSCQVKDNYTRGGASTFGGVAAKDNDGKKVIYLSDLYGIPVVTTADGPCGVRISDKATMMPCGNVIGCTWDLDLIERLFELEGEELMLNQVDNLLGPGINLHRDPRCGRNFEYFSEDPLVSGRMAAVMVKGAHKSGATLTAKHFACNNCENHIDKRKSIRGDADAIISERALRELYLKIFEIYVKEGNAQSIMTAYNPVNGVWAASCYDLNTEILRNEWGFEGLVMTDWWAKMSNHAWADGKRENGDKYVGSMIKAQNDIWMTCEKDPYDNDGNVKNRNKINNFLGDIKSGYLKRSELQRSAVNICNFIMKTQAFSRKHKTDFAKDIKDKFYTKKTQEWFTVEQAELGDPQLKEVTVDGRKISNLSKNVTEYKVYLPADATEFPEVKAVAGDGTTVEVVQATKDNRVAVVKATEQNYTKDFRIVFTDEEGITPILENAVLASLFDIKVNGKSINGFDAKTYEYGVAVDSLEKQPEVTYTAPKGVTAKVTYDSAKKITNVQCISADQAISYCLKYGIAPKSDEFNETKLSDVWTIENENEANWKIKDGHLVIGAEYGSIWQNQDHLKNRIVQSAYGDWEAVVKIDLPELPSLAYQSLGVIAMEDLDNYIYVKMESNGNGYSIALCQEELGSIRTLDTIGEKDAEKFTDAMYIKMQKFGDTYVAFVSPDGKEYIRFATAAEGAYENPKFMLVNGNGDKELSEVLEAQFDYVHFKTEALGDTVEIKDDAKIKLAEVTPVARSSSMKTAACEDEDGGLLITNFKKDAYLTYNVKVEKSGYYDVITRFASPYDGLQQVTFTIYADNELLTGFFTGGTSGDQNWIDLKGGNVRLSAGEHKIKVVADSGGFSLNWLQFKLTKAMDDTALRAAIETAKSRDLTSYTEEQQKKYLDAIENAEKVLVTAEGQDAIDAALKVITDLEEEMGVNEVTTTITSDIDQASIEVGQTIKLNVTVTPEEQAEKLKWTSETPDVASVGDDGTVTGLAAGTATIVVSIPNEVQKKFVITVTENSKNDGNNDNGTEGGDQTENGNGSGTEGGNQNGNGNGNGNGTVGDGTGGSELPGTGGDNVPSDSEGVTPPAQQPDVPSDVIDTKYMDGVTVKPRKTTLYYGGDTGKTTLIDVDLSLGAGLQSVKYTTNKPKVVKISDAGKITAKGKGTATVIAKVTLSNGETKDFSFDVTVKKAYIKKVTVPSSLKVGKSKTLKAKAYGSSKKITWKIKSGSKYAKITKKGKLTANAKGKVKVEAKSGNIKKSFTIKIK